MGVTRIDLPRDCIQNRVLQQEFRNMATSATRATLADLYDAKGKAELINGSIVYHMPTGDLPSDVANEIYVSLRGHVKTIKRGVAKADGVGYAVPELPSGRES